MMKNLAVIATTQSDIRNCSNQASMLLPVFPSTIQNNHQKDINTLNDIQKLLQPALSQEKPAVISPTTAPSTLNSPTLPSNSPSLTNVPPSNSSSPVNKNLWFSPHVFLKSFPVFPPPTRNLTNSNEQTPMLPIFPKKEEQPEKKSGYTSSNEHEKRSVYSSSSSNNSIRKQRKTKRNKIDIPLNELIRFMTLPQSVAAKKLNVSLSTLKRRYYELVSEFEGSKDTKAKWPSMPTNYHELSSTSEEAIPPEQKGSLQYILNRYDAHDNTFVDSLSMTVLNFSFKQHLTNSSNDE
ncbi:hypothetical protein FDP41_012894 [Naegleria fowleri]|uniref:RWP-RK domain-containing protein n=1 Tax=Naegleria fowleri TaxID=5763 RepID=A0A6A5C093_NAEFO|nr:uncharacterized protein FDP41_012894 [Naegleria fowleri]KAF0981106.1 hypothetical protein FDP41_012894 [Naegleria fowleri]